MADTVLQLAARAVDKSVIMPLRYQLVSRRLATANPDVAGDGVFNVDITTLSDMGDAIIKYELPSDKDARDSIKSTRTTVNIPVIGKNFEIPREAFEAYRRSGIMFDTVTIETAMRKVAEQEDTLCIQGWKPDGTNYQISGFYTGAGNDFSTSKDFGTFGYATDAVAGAIALAEADSVFPRAWNLLLNPVQANELRASRSTNGVREQPDIIEMLNNDQPNGPGSIIKTTAITAGTGLLTPVDPDRSFIQYYRPRDLRTQLGEDSKYPDTSPIYGAAWELVYPHIKYDVSLVKLSAI